VVRIALALEYDGSGFRGWQKQPGGNTVQDVLEASLSQFADVPVQVVCAGRTDAGVHATAQVVHFDSPVERSTFAWVRGTNSFLPATVAARWARLVAPDFHARFSARGRRYRYLLLNRAHRTGVWHDKIGWYHHPLDVEAMQAAANLLIGEHDFSAFRAADCQAASPVKVMRQAAIRRCGDLISFEFEASAFLHHMVRNLVGSLVRIGQGMRPPEWLGELLAAGDRRLAAPTFAAAGLYLVAVSYPPELGLPSEEGSAFLPFLTAT